MSDSDKKALDVWADALLDYIAIQANTVDLCTRDALNVLDARFDAWFEGEMNEEEE